jgi:hypothetical protein
LVGEVACGVLEIIYLSTESTSLPRLTSHSSSSKINTMVNKAVFLKATGGLGLQLFKLGMLRC